MIKSKYVKAAIASLAITAILYLAGAFIANEFNAGKWSLEGRTMYVFAVFAFAWGGVGIICLNED